ncbi:MAG: hypothetical protein IPI49_33255 [Myxococcales bacterium]|nr:hypothetical protein [Myxococcales bacterium]
MALINVVTRDDAWCPRPRASRSCPSQPGRAGGAAISAPAEPAGPRGIRRSIIDFIPPVVLPEDSGVNLYRGAHVL